MRVGESPAFASGNESGDGWQRMELTARKDHTLALLGGAPS